MYNLSQAKLELLPTTYHWMGLHGRAFMKKLEMDHSGTKKKPMCYNGPLSAITWTTNGRIILIHKQRLLFKEISPSAELSC